MKGRKGVKVEPSKENFQKTSKGNQTKTNLLFPDYVIQCNNQMVPGYQFKDIINKFELRAVPRLR
jgi:hypothetical protein